MRYVITILLLTFLAGCETSRNVEDPNLMSYIRLIGKEGDQTGRDVVVWSDNTTTSIFILGNTTSRTLNQQLYVVRTTSEGHVMWERSIGDINDDEARDLELLVSNDRLVILAMRTDISSGNRDYVIRLMTLDGVVTDSVARGAPTHTEEAFTISETNDSFIVSGHTTDVNIQPNINPADGFFDRYNKNLTPYSGGTWLSKHGYGDGFDAAVKTIEVGTVFYVIGYSNRLEALGDSNPDYNAFLWILSADGGVKNDFSIGNSFIAGSTAGANETVSSVSVVPIQSGSGYVVSGYSTDQANGANDQRIFNFRLRGDLQSVSNTKPDGSDNTEVIFAINPVADAGSQSTIGATGRGSIYPSQGFGFFVLGSKSPNGNEDIYLKKLDNGLKDVWSSPSFFTFGGVGNDLPGGVAETADGRVIVVGTMLLGESDATGQKKVILMKLSPNGKLGE